MIKKIELFIFSVLLLCVSCDRPILDIHSFTDNEWVVEDTITFDFNIKDATVKKELSLFFRNTLNYEFRNLFLLMELYGEGYILETDTIEYAIADKYGQWLGSGLGETRDNYFLLNQSYNFPKTGNYRIVIKHGMRSNPLVGVSKLGFKFK